MSRPVRINKMYSLHWVLNIFLTRVRAKVKEIMARLSYIVAIISIALTCVLAEEFYSNRYDDVDVSGIFNNPKLREQYYKCFMDLAPCKTADAKFFKGISNIQYYTHFFSSRILWFFKINFFLIITIKTVILFKYLAIENIEFLLN